MEQETYYKNGKKATVNKSQRRYYLAAGWSLTPPSSTSPAKPSPSAPRDTSQHTVWKNGKSTIVHGHELQSYLDRGYTSSVNTPPANTPSSEWNLSKWQTTGQGSWRNQPILTINGTQYRFNSPQEYINKMKGLTGSNAQKFIGQFQNVLGEWNAPSVKPETITPEQLAPVELPEVEEPYQPVRDVFGQNWKPAPIFEQLGLTEQGIYGAVIVNGQTYTIGEGGRLETDESFRERFGTDDRTGIAKNVTLKEAIALGINVEADSLVSDIKEKIPESFTAEMTPEQKAQIGNDILAASEIKYGVDGLREEKNNTTLKLIETIKEMWDKFEEAKEKKEADLKMEEKNKAISDAQTAYTKVKSVYDKYINELTYSSLTSAQARGLQAKARSQMAIELAPLSAAIQIAQGNWDRAKEILDDFSNDWKDAQDWKIKAAQMQIDLLGENLTEVQKKSKLEAQNKLDWFREDYNRILDTQEEVKKLMLMYPEAGVSITDSWENAYKKIGPYVKDETDFERRMKEVELATAEKALNKPYYKPSGGSSGTSSKEEKTVKWSQWVEDTGLTGQPQWMVDDIFNLKSPPSWFEQSMEETYQMSKDWTKEWTEERNKVLDIYNKRNEKKEDDDEDKDEDIWY